MLSPKEEAKNLIGKFIPYSDTLTNCAFENAKQCATISVNKILQVAFYATEEIYNHYLEVKKEIELC